MTPDEKIRILIADDFTVLLQAIKQLIERTPGLETAGVALNLDDALQAAQDLEPDVILMNDYLPPINSAHATQKFRELGFSAAILIISMQLERDMIEKSLSNGANGVMHKDELFDFLETAVRTVHNNEQYLSPNAKATLSNSGTS